MFRHKWFFSFTLLLSLLLLATLALLGGSARAQQLSKAPDARLPLAVQSYIADMGEHNPFVQAMLHRHSNSASTTKPAAVPDRPPQCGTWEQVPTQNPGLSNTLQGVAGSKDDLWAVGSICVSGCGTVDEIYHTLIEHWNGTAWSVVPSPNVGDSTNYLYSVSVASKRDAWAVGVFQNADTGFLNSLALHWDGSSWSVVPSPNAGAYNNFFDAVLAASTNNVLVTGGYRVRPGVFVAWALRWNGREWVDTQPVNPGAAYNLLGSATMITPNDVWAVGRYCQVPNCSTGSFNLTEHYDGHTWTVVPSPDIPDNLLLGSVSGASNRDVWAVGNSCQSPDCENYALHWDGSAWSVVPVPNNAEGGAFWDVLAISRDNAYIFGSQTPDFNGWRNLVLHWDGSVWTEVTVPSPGSYDNNLWASTALSHGEVWALGDQSDGDTYATQALHYSGDCNPSH